MIEVKSNYYKATEKLLYNYSMLKVNIENALQELEEIKDESGINAINYENTKISETCKITQSTENQAIKNITKEKLLKKKIEITQSKIDKIDRAINKLNPREKEIIKMFYIEGKQWYEIAFIVKYSERHCKRIRQQAIRKIAVGIYGEDAIEGMSLLCPSQL